MTTAPFAQQLEIDESFYGAGDDLSELIGQVEAQMLALGIEKWSELTKLAGDPDPKSADRRVLVRLIGRLGQLVKQLD